MQKPILSARKVRQLIEDHKKEIAFITGNGINRHCQLATNVSWDKLLCDLGQRVSPEIYSVCPPGISYTEFYDLLELEKRVDLNLQKIVKELLSEWQPHDHHRQMTKSIQQLNVPLLTTNFDTTFADSVDAHLFKTDTKKFTDYYPWTAYHGPKQLESPGEGFGIWHINGMIRYHRSIRLGLCQYMGNVERARNMIYKDKNKLYNNYNPTAWKGSKTWLDLMFNRSLFIFGMTLDENEVFLRWLLLERKKYFNKFPERAKKGWYLCCELPPSSTSAEIATWQGKQFFLEKIGFEILQVKTYAEIYEHLWKNNPEFSNDSDRS